MQNFEGITIAADVLGRILRTRDGRAALYYLQAASGGGASPEDVAQAMGWSVAEAGAARAVLETAGLLSPLKAMQPDNSIQAYSADDLTNAYENQPEFAELVRYAQQRLNTILKPADLGRLLGIYETLELSAGVLMLLISWCADRALSKEQSAPVRMFTVEREAYRWKNAGIDSEHAAEQHIRRMEEREGEVLRLTRLLQIKDRTPTKTEREYLERWASLGLADEVVYAAYDRTCVNTGSLKWGYMNKILEDWAQNGVPAAAPPAVKPENSASPQGSAQTEVQKAYERMRKKQHPVDK